jgi:hypothetical protein
MHALNTIGLCSDEKFYTANPVFTKLAASFLHEPPKINEFKNVIKLLQCIIDTFRYNYVFGKNLYAREKTNWYTIEIQRC